MLLEETADLFSVNISKNRDGQFFFISNDSNETDEVLILSSASENENQLLKVVAPCLSKVFYEVQRYQNRFYILGYTDGGTPNMHPLTLPVQPHSQDFLWQRIVIQEDSQTPPQITHKSTHYHPSHNPFLSQPDPSHAHKEPRAQQSYASKLPRIHAHQSFGSTNNI